MFGMKPTIESLESAAVDTAAALEVASAAVNEAEQTDTVTATDATLKVLDAARVTQDRARRRNDSAVAAVANERSRLAAETLATKQAEYARLLAQLKDPAVNYCDDEICELVALDEKLADLIVRFESARAKQIADLNAARILGRELGSPEDISQFDPQSHAQRALAIARQSRRERLFAEGIRHVASDVHTWLQAPGIVKFL